MADGGESRNFEQEYVRDYIKKEGPLPRDHPLYHVAHDIVTSGNYRRWLSWRARNFGERLTKAGLSKGSRVLDVGCGHGWASAAGTQQGFEMIGIDIHQELLDMAMSRAREGGHVMDLVLASAEHLPFAEESFDGAICVDVLEHVADDKGVLRQIHGALKGSGKLYFSAPNVFWLLSSHTSIYERLLRLYKFLGSSSRRSAYEESERSYSYFELTPLIVSQGFHDLRVLPPSVEFADFFDEPLRTIARIFYGPISALRLMNVFQPGFAVVCSKGGS